jgi:hypothetical protein
MKVRALETLCARGVPYFADSLEFTESLLRYVSRNLVDGERRAALYEFQRRLNQLFEVAMPSGHFFTLAGIPRPTWLGKGSEPLLVLEMRALL